MERKKNRHESLYHSTVRVQVMLIILWIGAMLLAALTPARLQRSDVAFVVFAIFIAQLLLAMLVVGIVNIVSYMRWTGKYPFYFLFHKWRRPHDSADEGQEKERFGKKGSA